MGETLPKRLTKGGTNCSPEPMLATSCCSGALINTGLGDIYRSLLHTHRELGSRDLGDTGGGGEGRAVDPAMFRVLAPAPPETLRGALPEDGSWLLEAQPGTTLRPERKPSQAAPRCLSPAAPRQALRNLPGRPAPHSGRCPDARRSAVSTNRSSR